MNLFISTFGLLVHAAYQQNKNQSSEDNLRGIKKFLANPNQYVLDFGDWLGKIINASIEENGKLTIEFFFQKNGKKLLGKLIGKFDPSKNQFSGFQNTEENINSETFRLSFKRNGEAKGTYQNGKKEMTMLLS